MHHKELGFDQMIVAIDTIRDLGHIVVDAVNRPFNSMDKNSLWVLKENIDQQMKKDEFIRNSKGFAYENFLKDLLDDYREVISGAEMILSCEKLPEEENHD